MNKTVPILSFLVVLVAVLFSFNYLDSTRVKESVLNFIKERIIIQPNSDSNSAGELKSKSKLKVFSKTELSEYKGEHNGKVYLAIIGSVFDVTKGRKHYGPGGGYEFFAGIDGSKAFVTGQFDAEGLIDDISDLSEESILSLNQWKSFYEKDYVFVGLVQGAFYDESGEEKDMMKLFKKKLKSANLQQDLVEKDRRLFPPCNSEWSQDTGSRVWCSKLSGGIQRDWEGVPRMYFTAGKSTPRCACVRQTGPPSHDLSAENHKNNGDLDNPNLNVYPGCDPSSVSCMVKD